MGKLSYIKNAGYCRTCLNKLCRLNLKRQDVIIHYYKQPCRNCKKVTNIVCGVKARAYGKLLFMKKIHF